MKTPEELKKIAEEQSKLTEAELVRVNKADEVISAAMVERPSQKVFTYPKANLENLTDREIAELDKRVVAAGWKSIEVTADNLVIKAKRLGGPGRKPGTKNKPKTTEPVVTVVPTAQTQPV